MIKEIYEDLHGNPNKEKNHGEKWKSFHYEGIDDLQARFLFSAFLSIAAHFDIEDDGSFICLFELKL